MIGLAKPHPHLLSKPEDCPSQQSKRYSKKKACSIFMSQPEKCAQKSHDQEHSRAQPTKKRQVYRTVQKFGPLPQARNVRLEVGPRDIAVADFIQAAYPVQDTCHPTEQDRDEGGHGTENEGRSRRLRHHLCKLARVRDKIHANVTSVREAATDCSRSGNYRHVIAVIISWVAGMCPLGAVSSAL
jgi:hypothetical protein